MFLQKSFFDFGNLQALNIGSILTEVNTNNQIVFQLEYDNGANLYRAQKFDWFFYTPPNPSWDCIMGSCVDLGNGMGVYNDSIQCIISCNSTNIEEIHNANRKLIKIVDVLGRETPYKNNTPLFYIYNDGTVEKRIIIE